MDDKDRTLLDELRDQGEKLIMGVINDFLTKKTFPGTRKKIDDAHRHIDRNLNLVLYTLNLPSRRDLDRIERKIETMNEKARILTGKIDELLRAERS